MNERTKPLIKNILKIVLILFLIFFLQSLLLDAVQKNPQIKNYQSRFYEYLFHLKGYEMKTSRYTHYISGNYEQYMMFLHQPDVGTPYRPSGYDITDLFMSQTRRDQLIQQAQSISHLLLLGSQHYEEIRNIILEVMDKDDFQFEILLEGSSQIRQFIDSDDPLLNDFHQFKCTWIFYLLIDEDAQVHLTDVCEMISEKLLMTELGKHFNFRFEIAQCEDTSYYQDSSIIPIVNGKYYDSTFQYTKEQYLNDTAEN